MYSEMLSSPLTAILVNKVVVETVVRIPQESRPTTLMFFQIKPRLLSLGTLLSIREHLQPTRAVNTHDSPMKANVVCDSLMSRTD